MNLGVKARKARVLMRNLDEESQKNWNEAMHICRVLIGVGILIFILFPLLQDLVHTWVFGIMFSLIGWAVKKIDEKLIKDKK
ncbi:hypothetical protein GCM10008967_37930 [Bacillus carboniphilus]|uniref:Uncharacterized protein n=1 Tax=Bacillus carboniphilus TaxID=86663 RepID=A0ABN0WQ54_9BACI